jgi:hypothetical protein
MAFSQWFMGEIIVVEDSSNKLFNNLRDYFSHKPMGKGNYDSSSGDHLRKFENQ